MRKMVTSRRWRALALLMCVCMMCMVYAMPIVAYAANYKVVTDDYGNMLTSQEIGKIEEYASKLKQYNVAVYIGYEDSATGDVVDKVAIKEYEVIFGVNDNGVLITIVFDEENYNVSVAVGDNVPFTGSQINQVADLVYGSYWDYESDAEWIVGSFKAVTEYIGNIEAKNPVQSDKPSTTPQPENNQGGEKNETPDNNVGANANKGDTEKQKKSGVGAAVLAAISSLFTVGGVAGCVVLNKKNKQQLAEKDAEIRRSVENRDALSADLDTANAQCTTLREQLEACNDWREEVFAACPDIEARIKDYHAKTKAENFLRKYPVESLEGRDSSFYSHVLNSYRSLSEDVCAYLPYNIENLTVLYEKAKDDEAKEEARSFMSKYPSIDVAVSSSGYEEVTRILDEYDRLSYAAKTYVTFDMKDLRTKQEECAKLYAKEAEEKLKAIYDTYPEEVESKSYYDEGYNYYEALPPMVRTYIPDPFWMGYMARRSLIHRVHHEHHHPPRRPEFESRPEPYRTSGGYTGSPNRGSSGSGGSGIRTSSSNPPSSRRTSTPSRPSTISRPSSPPRRTTPPRTSTPRSGGGRRR